nr:O-antigen ligase family protein [Acinetobacter sp. YH16040]
MIGETMFRASGTFGHPGILSQFIVVISPIFLMAFRSFSGIKSKFFLLISIFSIYIVVQTYARTGIFILSVILFVFYVAYIFDQKRIKNKIYGLFLGFMSAVFLFKSFSDQVMYRFNNADVSSSNTRNQLNNVAFDMFFDNPFFGVGLNTFTEVLSRYDSFNVVSYLNYPVHNIYLLILSETGMVGFVSFMIINFFVIIDLYRIMVSQYFISIGNFAFSFLLAYLAMLLFAFLGWSWRIDCMQGIYFLLLACASTLRYNLNLKVESKDK